VSGEASAVLHTPYPVDPIPDLLDEIIGITDWVSPGALLRKAIEFALGEDPAMELIEKFTGDWEEVSTVSSAVTQVGEYFGQVGLDVETVRAELMQTWEGNAASGASAYFEELALAIDELRGPMDEIADAYQTLAIGAYDAANAVSGLLNMLLDYLVELGITLAATGAFGWTGVGLAIGGAGTAYLAYKATSTWLKVVEACGDAVTIAQGTIAVAAGAAGVLTTTVPPELELGAPTYDHPAESV